MPVSKQEDMMVNLQRQMQVNQQEMQEYLMDLNNWESNIKKKDDCLKKEKVEETKSDLPPVRNSLNKKKIKKKKKKSEVNGNSKPKRISSYDYRSWDKFDVDKACEDLEKTPSEGSSSYETDEEWEDERRKHHALLEKDKGNEYFKKGDYDKAIESYTKGIDLDPTNAILPANRAMALLKQEKFATAELDCSTALSLDPEYIKAYLRRATARAGLRKIYEANEDYKKVLKLEPENKKAKDEIEKLEKELEREKEEPKQAETFETTTSGIVRPIYKPPETRSTKPLKRIEIEEIGVEEDETRLKIAETELNQSETKRKITSKDYETFEKFTSDKTKTSLDSKFEKYSSTDTRNAEESQIINTLSTKPNETTVVYKPAVQDSNTERITGNNVVSEKVTEEKLPNDIHKPVPLNSFQFQADYKCLKNDLKSFHMYINKIDPRNYPKLLGEYLDADILIIFLKSFQKFSLPAGDNIIDNLKFLSQVKRFSMVVMFLSSAEKTVIREIFDAVEKSGFLSSEIEKMAKLYGIN